MEKYFLFICLLVCQLGLAQQIPAPIKWGKISKSDLKLEQTPDEAPAVVLADYGLVKLDALVKGPNYYLRRHRRVKVFNPEAFAWKGIPVDFYQKDNQEKLDNFRVQLITPSGKKTMIDKKSVTVEQLPNGMTRHFIPLPQLKPGTIVEYQYELESRRVQQLRTWYFQEEIPVLYSEYRLEQPRDMDYASRWFGIDSLVEVSYSEPTPRLIEEGEYWGIAGDFKVYLDAHRYILKNAPAFASDHCMSSSKDYRTGVSLYLRKVSFPDGSKRVYMDTWENMTTDLLSHPRLGRELTEEEQSTKLVQAAKPLLRTREANSLKVRRIHDWLLENVKWNQHYSIFCKESLDEAFSKGEANSGERNLMLLKLMQIAGLEAYPVLVSTRKHGKVSQQYPFAPQFNHLMVYWQKNEDSYQILDLSDNQLPFGFPRPEALNGEGWLLHPDSPKWIDLNPATAADIYLVTAELKEDGSCSAKIKATYTGYAAYEKRTTDPYQRWSPLLNYQGEDFIVSNIETKYKEELEEPFKEYVSINKAAQKTASGQLKLKPILFSRFLMPYPKESRPYPIDMMYPLSEQYIFILKLPEGYEIEKLPETGAGSLADSGGLFLFDTMQKDRILQVVSKIQINQLKYTPEEYPNVFSFFELVIEKFGEEIVLKKIQDN